MDIENLHVAYLKDVVCGGQYIITGFSWSEFFDNVKWELDQSGIDYANIEELFVVTGGDHDPVSEIALTAYFDKRAKEQAEEEQYD